MPPINQNTECANCKHYASLHYGLNGECSLCAALLSTPCHAFFFEEEVVNKQTLPIALLWERK